MQKIMHNYAELCKIMQNYAFSGRIAGLVKDPRKLHRPLRRSKSRCLVLRARHQILMRSRNTRGPERVYFVRDREEKPIGCERLRCHMLM
jgi:hypothetical protein